MKLRNRIAGLLLALCLVVGVLPTAAFAAGTGTHLVLGDSISTGYDVAVEERFSHRVAEHYGLNEVNRAVNGFTATNLKELLNSGELDEEIASASLITLTIGGNEMVDILCNRIANIYNSKANNTTKITADEVIGIMESASNKMLWAIQYVVPALKDFPESAEFNTALAAYKQNLTDSLNYIRSKNTTVEVVVCTQFTPFKQFRTVGVFQGAYVEVDTAAKLLNEVITKNAATLGYKVADIYPIFDKSTESLFPGDDSTNLNDLSLTNVHPNARGHELIAQTIIDLDLTIVIPEAPLPFEPGVSAVYVSEQNVSLADGTVKVNLNAMDGKMSVTAAFYNGSKMVGVDHAIPAASDTEITLSADLHGEATSVRVFLMGSDFAPVTAPVTYPAA